jgi:glyoxylase-like metal-dependent hydrolase (beta-lactamase superfamily II)
VASVNKSFNVGRAKVTAVDELTVSARPYSELLRPYDQALFEERRDLMPPDYSRNENEMVAKVQHWLVQVDGRNILIDSGFGNGKHLPGLPPEFSNLNTLFLENLRSEGVSPERVDTVFMTHVHVDHVGWNTQWDGAEWMPTYSKARHIMTETERHYWDSTSAHYRPSDHGRAVMRNCFEESVLPIIREGLAQTFEVDARIDDQFELIPMPGHTPGQVAIKFVCEGEGVLFAGDAIHHPIQVVIPEWCMVFDEDPDTSVKSRRLLLAMCADENLVLAPAHFVHGACRVTRSADGFRAQNLEMFGSDGASSAGSDSRPPLTGR